jgi:membrane-bound lytic murein transglycosylase D
MQSKPILAALFLFVSACAQVPMEGSTGERPLAQSMEPAAQPVKQDVASKTPPADSQPPAVASPAQPKRSTVVTSSGERDEAPSAFPTPVPAKQPELPKNLWGRIGKGFAMAPMENELVRDWENWYSSRPDYVARMIDRSSRFLFHIVEEVERRGMPMEIALLPMIESAYNPVAYSRSHASGIWQFIPSTGKDFGLRQNWWYDGRRDVLAATNAALDYLQKLYGMFGDWNLALASYNWGEGAVGRAMERNRVKGLPTDYESLTVPGETRNYLPKLIAVKNIISNPARYGLTIADVPNESYFETVRVKHHIDMKVAAKLADMPLTDFKFLNPGHNKPVIKAGEAERIVLPKDKVATFLTNLEKYEHPLASWQAVTFRKGDKAEKVAAQHGMTLAELKEVNGLANQRKLVVGQPLLVPLKGSSENLQLPDLPANPLSLGKALQVARNSGPSRQYVKSDRGGKVASRKVTPGVMVTRSARQPAAPLRAEAGKQVKIVLPKAAAKKKVDVAGQREKVAGR